MGLRRVLARWLNGPEAPNGAPLGQRADLERHLVELVARVDKLELERPAFMTELEAIAERCHDILDVSESKRGRAAASLSRARKKEEQQDEAETLYATDRERQKAEVRALLRAQGKLQ